MHDRVLETLYKVSAAELIADINSRPPDVHATIIADDYAKRIKLTKIKDHELISLHQRFSDWPPLLSTRILYCRSRDQITELHEGDTIITPDGLWQIHPGFQDEFILNEKELFNIIPSMPGPDTELIIINTNDEPIQDDDSDEVQHNKMLTAFLNKGLIKKSHSLYLSNEFSPSLTRTKNVLKEIKNKLEEEIKYRKLSNMIYEAFKVKTAIEFVQLAKEKYQEHEALCHAQGQYIIAADQIVPYLVSTLPLEINLCKLSNQDLSMLANITQLYRLYPSHHIIRAQSTKAINDAGGGTLGDTFIIPDGILQIDYDGLTHMLLSAEQMQKILPPEMIPNEHTVLETLDTHNQLSDPNERDIQLPLILNPALKEKPHALPLGRLNNNLDISQISTHIVRAGALAMNELKELQYHKPNTTWIVPEGVYQIDAEGQPHQVLTQNEMQKALPPELWPYPTLTPEQFYCNEPNDERAVNLTNILNRNLAKQSNALYLDATQDCVYKTAGLAGALYDLVDTERNRRALQTNLILNALRFKSDTEFMSYFINRLYPGPDAKIPLADHIKSKLSERITLASFDDDQLKTLAHQCTIWSPQVSPRILCANSFPQHYQLGDTILVPEGIYQIRRDNKTGKIIQEKIISQAELATLKDLEFPNTSEVRITEKFDKPDTQRLQLILNTILGPKPNALYIHPIDGNYTTVNTVLAQLVKDELAQRALHRFTQSSHYQSLFKLPKLYSFFKVQDRKTSAQPNQPHPKNVSDLQQNMRHLKNLQKTLQAPSPLSQKVTPSSAAMVADIPIEKRERTIDTIYTTMHEIKTELNFCLSDTFSVAKSTDLQSVQILQAQRPVMEVSQDKVVMYKPMLQAKLKDLKKAELFLQSMDIPPTEGISSVKIHGGNHRLRTTIRTLFKQYKDLEQLKKDTDSNTTASESDSNNTPHY